MDGRNGRPWAPETDPEEMDGVWLLGSGLNMPQESKPTLRIRPYLPGDSHTSVNALTSIVLSPCVPSYEGTPVYRGTKDCHRESPLESVSGQGPGHRCKHLMLASLPDRMNTPIQQLQVAGCQENMLAGRGAQETLKGGLIGGCYGF